MKKNGWLVLLLCCGAICFAVQRKTQPLKITAFELYSWQDAKGRWIFSLLPAVSNSGFHPDVIMSPANATPGLKGLKAKIKPLAEGSEIIWLDHATGMWQNAGWDRIKLPTPEVVERVRQYCEEKHLKLSIDAKKN